MGFNSNDRLRPKELLQRVDETVELVRREETGADHFAILEFDGKVLETREHASVSAEKLKPVSEQH